MIKSTQEIGNSYNPQLDQTPHCLLRALLVVFLPKTWVRILATGGELSSSSSGNAYVSLLHRKEELNIVVTLLC